MGRLQQVLAPLFADVALEQAISAHPLELAVFKGKVLRYRDLAKPKIVATSEYLMAQLQASDLALTRAMERTPIEAATLRAMIAQHAVHASTSIGGDCKGRAHAMLARLEAADAALESAMGARPLEADPLRHVVGTWAAQGSTSLATKVCRRVVKRSNQLEAIPQQLTILSDMAGGGATEAIGRGGHRTQEASRSARGGLSTREGRCRPIRAQGMQQETAANFK